MIDLQKAEFKDPWKKVKNYAVGWSRRLCWDFTAAAQNGSLYGPHVLTCLTTSGHAPNGRTDGVPVESLLDLDQVITELLDSTKCWCQINWNRVVLLDLGEASVGALWFPLLMGKMSAFLGLSHCCPLSAPGINFITIIHPLCYSTDQINYF